MSDNKIQKINVRHVIVDLFPPERDESIVKLNVMRTENIGHFIDVVSLIDGKQIKYDLLKSHLFSSTES